MGNDVITLSASGSQLRLNTDGAQIRMTSIEILEINSHSGNDTFTVSNTAGTALTNLNIYPGEGDDTLNGEGATLRIDVFDDFGNNTFIGGTAGDSLNSGSGNDLLFGNAGNDALRSGLGDDRLYGGAGDDYLLSDGGDSLMFGGAGNDTLDNRAGNSEMRGGAGDDFLFSGADDQRMFGGTGSDYLAGGGGDDLLVGGLGDDTLLGDGGQDMFIYHFSRSSQSGRDGNDRIENFQTATDHLVLDAFDSRSSSDGPVTVSDVDGNVIFGFENGGGEITLIGIGNGSIDSVAAARSFGIDIEIT
jgi:Ca2+-binding RTX toxin-like protein